MTQVRTRASICRARRHRDAAKDRSPLRRRGKHPKQHAGGLIGIVQHDPPALLLHAKPVGQSRGGSLDSIVVKRAGKIGKLSGLLQDHALQPDHFLIQHQIRAGHQRGIQRFADVDLIGLQMELRQEAIEPV